MAYCCVEATEYHFDEARARDELRAYRRGTFNKPTRLLLDALGRRLGEIGSVLEIGGGVGVVLHELMPATLRRAAFVEASSAYLAVARQEAVRLGYADRVRFVHGDLLEQAEQVPVAEAVVLNRVICCYPDVEALLGAVAAKSLNLCALSYPRDRWYVRLGHWWSNWRRNRSGDPFRTFVHPEREVARLLGRLGFSRVYAAATLTWTVALYRRDAPG